MSFRIFGLISLTILLSACRPFTFNKPSYRISLDEPVLVEDFDQIGRWDEYDLEGVTLQVENSFYRMRFNIAAYVWGQNHMRHQNVVVEVDALQNSDYERNGYGLMCRVSPQNNGHGYYFLISSDGYYSIRRGAAGAVEPLVTWEYSDAINRGKQRNIIRAVCVDDYLALYVNDQFLTETFDNFYYQGAVGIAGVITGNGEFDAVFDDLKVWNASLR